MNWTPLPRPIIGTMYHRDSPTDTEPTHYRLLFYRVVGDVLEYMTEAGTVLKARDFTYITVPGVHVQHGRYELIYG